LAKIWVITNPSTKDLQEYITWILTQDSSKNPVNDPTGERAARNRGRYEVWSILGTINHENKITRKCTVPSNTEILILAATSDSSYLEHERDGAQNDEQLLAIAKAIAELHKDVEITIIHQESGEQQTFRVENAKNPKKDELQLIETPAFPIIIPENNIYKDLYGVQGGYTHLAVVGWGIKVKLEPGKYTLILKAQHGPTPEDQPLDVQGLKVDVIPFNLDIEYELKAISEKGSLSPFAKYPE
jgi:hypothetical protein